MKRDCPINFTHDHPDPDVNRRRQAMNIATAASQSRAGFHCPRCTAVQRTVVLLAEHILNDHLPKKAEPDAAASD